MWLIMQLNQVPLREGIIEVITIGGGGGGA